MELGLKGKTAVITAASKGLGKQTALQLAAEGCSVALCSRSEDNLKKAALEIEDAAGAEVFYKTCDLNKKADIEAFYNAAADKFNNIDILVNNCGGPPADYFEDISEEEWKNSYDQVMLSAIRFIKLALPGMKKSGWGRVVNFLSMSVKQPVENLILSTTFRTGLVGMTKTLSTQYAADNITFNNIATGFILTERLESLAETKAKQQGVKAEDVLEEMASSTPAGRIGKPEDIANTAVFLASEAAGYLTGNTINVDGGKISALF